MLMGVVVHYSSRVTSIVNILLSQVDFIAVSDIAKALNISKRTVFRELDDVSVFLKQQGVELITRTRLGIKVNASLEQAREIRRVLDQNQRVDFTQDERQRIIQVELLRRQEPNKLYYYANMLYVSEATISNDMDKLEPWFKKHQIQLIRRPGFGVYLNGDEVSLRRATVNFLYENIEHQDLIRFVSEGLSKSSMLDTVMDKTILSRVSMILDTFEDALKKKLTENAYLGLTIHLAIAVQRILNKEQIKLDGELLSDLQKDIQFEIARAIAERVGESFKMTFTQDEVGYICMHLKGSKLKTGSLIHKEDIILSNYDLTRLATQLIDAFVKDTGMNLSKDEQLLVGLVAHLRPAINRLHLSLQIRNPLLENIKSMYSEVFEKVRVLSKIIEEKYQLAIPESEVAYLAMHFGAAIERYERNQSLRHKLNVAIVCSSGLGTSSLLQSRLLKQFKRLHFIGQFSVDDIFQKQGVMSNVSFIVSTIALDSIIQNIPVVCVNPLLFDEDIQLIEQMIRLIENSGENKGQATLLPPMMKGKDHVQHLHELTEAILHIRNSFEVKAIRKVSNLSSFIKCVCEDLLLSASQINTLMRALIEREARGSTVLKGEGVVLLHTRTRAVETPIFNIWRVDKGLYSDEGERISLAIVMIIPSDSPKALVDVMSFLSKSLIREAGLLELLKKASKEDIIERLNHLLNQMLRDRLNEGDAYDT